MKFAVVVVGYNRPFGLKRLILSLKEADYLSDKVDLVISIDKGKKQQEIIDICEKIKWDFGEKHIRIFNENLGLRKHIIKCGDLTNLYDAVVVLEDDITVSKYFYNYAKQAIERYRNNEKIAGISLYKHGIHPKSFRPFEPVNNGYDVFFMQYAQSWGQCWTREMWRKFRDWYKININYVPDDKTPDYVSKWNKQSWLKYYIKYTINSDRYFVYPYVSLSTNHSDVGEHCNYSNNDFQVPLQEGKIIYRFPDVDQGIKYDAFFERIGIEDIIFPELKGKKMLDLYGLRVSYEDSKYVISTNNLPYDIVMEIALKYRPHEVNCYNPVQGKGLYIYDLSSGIHKQKNKVDDNIITKYDVKAIPISKLFYFSSTELLKMYNKKIKRLFNYKKN